MPLPFRMTSDLELGVPEVSLVSGLERFGGVLTQEVMGALWEGRKLVGWEQFWKGTIRRSVVLLMLPLYQVLAVLRTANHEG